MIFAVVAAYYHSGYFYTHGSLNCLIWLIVVMQ